jgi:hypothetical protein
MRAVGKWSRLVLLCAGLSWFGPVSASDDWDWSAFEAMGDAPVTTTADKPNVVSEPDAAQEWAEARLIENNVPDFDAPVRPAYPVFAGVAEFDVVPSKRDVEMHPCSNCHQWTKGNPEPRKLKPPHDNFELRHGLHGKGQFWCFTCHDMDNAGGLKTLDGAPVDFADAYIVCSQCHSQQARDWQHGAHGKRVANWQGRRQVLSCTACHYQHRPALKPREPMSGPVMRAGLARPSHWAPQSPDDALGHDKATGWQQEVDRRREAGGIRQASPEAAAEPSGSENETSG